MDSEKANEGLAKKNDHELLVLIVEELRLIRQTLVGGFDYSLNMDESRSSAWAAKYSGSGRVKTTAQIVSVGAAQRASEIQPVAKDVPSLMRQTEELIVTEGFDVAVAFYRINMNLPHDVATKAVENMRQGLVRRGLL